MTEKLTVLIAEDHQTVCEGLKLMIDAETDMEVVAVAGNGREAIKLAEQLRPDLVLLDISMPELNGLKAAAKLKSIAPQIKILILTRHRDDAYLQELIQAGVNGYILKQGAPAELVKAVRAVAGGERYLDPAMIDNVFRGFGDNSVGLRGDSHGEALTSRESETLRYVALGYSNQEIAAKLDISVKTVEAHKNRAMKKMNIESRREIVQLAVRKGWMQEN